MKGWLRTFMGLALAALPALDARATTPTFTSGPAVVSYPAGTAFPNTSTVVFGYSNGAMKVIPFVDSMFRDYTEVHTNLTGGYDGDPAAAYIVPGLPTIMNCGHSATGPGIYCIRGHVGNPGHYESAEVEPYRVGGGTFDPGTSPVLVHVVYQSADNLNLFARGQNGQIWYANYHQPSNSWNSWFQIPDLPGDTFSSDPAAWAYTPGDTVVMVCARTQLGAQIRCNQQQFGNGGTIFWAGWNTVPGQPSTAYKPALARGAGSVYLFGIRNVVSPNFQEWFTTFPVGGGSFAPFASVSGGSSGFNSGPTAVASTLPGVGPQVMTVGRRSDSAFWYAVGGPGDDGKTLTWRAWTKIDVP